MPLNGHFPLVVRSILPFLAALAAAACSSPAPATSTGTSGATDMATGSTAEASTGGSPDVWCDEPPAIDEANWPPLLAEALCAGWRAAGCDWLDLFDECETEFAGRLLSAQSNARFADLAFDSQCAAEKLDTALDAACGRPGTVPGSCGPCQLYVGSGPWCDTVGSSSALIDLITCPQMNRCSICNGDGPDDIYPCCKSRCFVPDCDCADGEYCEDDACVARKSAGEACLNDYECADALCLDGICYAGPAVCLRP